MTPTPSPGRLVLGGFDGLTLPASFARALRDGRRGGAILFKRNVGGDVGQVAGLTRAIREASEGAALVGVDQEGGRVARLGSPLLVVPPMRTVASWGDEPFAERIAHCVGLELAALGFTIAFAPVLDVNTRPGNPVIGDRAFGADPETCTRFGTAWIRGLQQAGVLACGKHFPGHGATSKDSHFDLPVVDHPLEHLERVDLAPFRAAASAGVASMMTAHVVYEALDPSLPATLSASVCTALRDRIGFHGALLSDDLEMRAVAARWSIEESAVLAIAAGCDGLLVCASEEMQERAVAALSREAAASSTFRARCEQAGARLDAAHKRSTGRPLDGEALAPAVGGAPSRAIAGEIAQRLGG